MDCRLGHRTSNQLRLRVVVIVLLCFLWAGTAYAEGVSESRLVTYLTIAYIGGVCLAWLIGMFTLARPTRLGFWLLGSASSVLAGIGAPTLGAAISPDNPLPKPFLLGAVALLGAHQIKFFVFRRPTPARNDDPITSRPSMTPAVKTVAVFLSVSVATNLLLVPLHLEAQVPEPAVAAIYLPVLGQGVFVAGELILAAWLARRWHSVRWEARQVRRAGVFIALSYPAVQLAGGGLIFMAINGQSTGLGALTLCAASTLGALAVVRGVRMLGGFVSPGRRACMLTIGAFWPLLPLLWRGGGLGSAEADDLVHPGATIIWHSGMALFAALSFSGSTGR